MRSLDLLKKYNQEGYCILKIFSTKQIEVIKLILLKRLKLLDKKKKLKNLKIHELSKYHNLNIIDKYHKEILKTSTRFIKLDRSLNNRITSNKFINLIMNDNWGHNISLIKWVGSLKKNNIKKNVIGFRISRPKKFLKKNDATGVHIDLHVGGKICDDKNVLISLWVPLIGFSSNYTLNISPKSHLINHPTNQFIKTKTVTNVFSEKYYKKFKFKRPKLKQGEALIFHPNLLHGNSFNHGNKTRFSLEVRLYNKINIKKWR